MVPNSSTGANWSAAVMPRSKALWVSSRTSQYWATDCIQVPHWETVWPKNQRR